MVEVDLLESVHELADGQMVLRGLRLSIIIELHNDQIIIK